MKTLETRPLCLAGTEEKVTWPVTVCRGPNSACSSRLNAHCLAPIPFVYLHIKRTAKDDRVDIGTPEGCD